MCFWVCFRESQPLLVGRFSFGSMVRQAAGLVLVHEATQRLLVVSKHPEPDKAARTWQLPKGRQRSVQESLLQTALRETKEETGLVQEKVCILHDLPAWCHSTPFGNVTFFAAKWLSSTSAEWWPVQDADIKWARWLPISQVELQVRQDQVCVARGMVNQAMSHSFIDTRTVQHAIRGARSRSPVMRRNYLCRPTPPPLPPTRAEYEAYHARKLVEVMSSSSEAGPTAPQVAQAIMAHCGSEGNRVMHPSPKQLVSKVNLKARQAVVVDEPVRVPPAPPPRPLPPPNLSGLYELWSSQQRSRDRWY